MSINYSQLTANELNISLKQVLNTEKLLAEGATIPFIARYRKEATGMLDEVQIETIYNRFQYYNALAKRKEAILKSIDKQGQLSAELKRAIENCTNETALEDLYLPYKPRKTTKADKARELGLEGLAQILMNQEVANAESAAKKYLTEAVTSTEMALQGARHIMAEWINENITVRNRLRQILQQSAQISSRLVKGKEEEAQKYRDYFDRHEPLSKCAPHRILAIFRAEQEQLLKVKIEPKNEEELLCIIERIYLKNKGTCREEVSLAIKDSLKRLLLPSIESELRKAAKEQADKASIAVFAQNLRQLLMAPPLGEKRILAIDPGFKSGCKVVCLDAAGELLHNETIYPHPPQNELKKAMSKIRTLVNQFKIDAIAIGDGTAGRETERMIQKIIFERKVLAFMINEDGASVYSAGAVGRAEFPNYDVTVRGAVSIGRRLMDPLSELIKIDPKSLGIGQYQHDVEQKLLKENLDRVVSSCVNAVGVNANTASPHLLHYVSGLGAKTAENIVNHRKEHGNFTSRKDLKKVKGLGEKAFEQAAGFLRIVNGAHPLDNSAVHPESYDLVAQIAHDLKLEISELLNQTDKLNSLDLKRYCTENVGLPTLEDIVNELKKPGRDPRAHIKVFAFDQRLNSINDLELGMIVNGVVSNVTHFGAFVDLGIKENGLIHVSNLANEFISNPGDVIKLNQHVQVKVLEVDVERKRIQLSLKDL